jgi:hypothetical protein
MQPSLNTATWRRDFESVSHLQALYIKAETILGVELFAMKPELPAIRERIERETK